jgi:uncharacterized protein (TIGR02453 family)
MGSFTGFPMEAVSFFQQLKLNNNKTWFETHKADYQNYVMEPAQAFIEDMGGKLAKLSPGIHAEPRVNRSIFRIYRDVRFSKDKTPYKTHLALWMWQGQGAKFESSGYYFHLEPPNILLGVGIHTFSKELLKAYRESVVDPESGPALVKAITTVSIERGYDLGGKHYKRVPRGFDHEHEYAEFLLFNGLTAGYEVPIPDEFYSAALLDYCYQKYAEMYPIQHWLFELTEAVKLQAE